MLKSPKTTLNVRLTRSMVDQLEGIAADFDVTLGQIVRDALGKFLEDFRQTEEEVPISKVDAEVLENCRRVVSASLSSATSWESMQKELRASDFEYFARGGGLAVRSLDNRRYIGKASEVGPGYSILIKRFKQPFPGHPHEWLAKRILQDGQ